MILGQAERLQELATLNKHDGKSKFACPVIAFTSGKGGTGKTFITVNTAYILSKLRRKVLVIDLDANLSNVNIILNIKPSASVYDFFINRSLLEDTIYQYEPMLHFIFGESGKVDHPELMANNVNALFEAIKKLSYKYDYIFLDTGSGAGEGVLSILSNSDYIFLVTNPEPTSIMDAYVIIKLLNKGFVRNKKLVIVNRCSGLAEGNNAFENLNKASSHFLREKLDLLGIVEYSPDVNRSILSQELFVAKYPNTKVMQQIKGLCKNIIGITKPLKQ